MGTLMKK